MTNIKIFKSYGGFILAALVGYLLRKADLDIYHNIVIILLMTIGIIILAFGEAE